MAPPRLKFWGWGLAGREVDPAEVARAVDRLERRLGVRGLEAQPAPRLDDIALAAPRLAVPESLGEICSTEPYDRIAHTYGKSYPDYVRTLAGAFEHAPDAVAFPRSEAEVEAVLDWANGRNAAVIPFGAGSTVVGGIEPAVGARYAGAVSVDLRGLDRVLEVDTASRAARIQAGVMGPDLEAQLRPHGLTLRHFPQSFEFSTLGGWIATRSGGHFATLFTHIDELVESLCVVTPAGRLETRRLPGSGAGPSPDRMFIGSEGILGLITEAWMRLQHRPTYRATRALWFTDFHAGAQAVRAIAQAGLYPANCRLIDADEAGLAGAGDGSRHLLVLGFESADHPVEAAMARALECGRDHGGEAGAEGEAGSDDAKAWRTAFIRAPYWRDAIVSRSIIADTYETAITWDRFADFHREMMATTAQALRRVTGREGSVTCRFTHVYPDGPAPYFTFHGLGRRDSLLAQWRDIKAEVSDRLIALGGTITHHHAVGRDHRPWYDRQRPGLFAEALRAAKRRLDPASVLNPGVLVDPEE